MKSLIQGFLTGMRGQARVLAPRQVISPRFSWHLNTPGEISPLWERIPCMGVQVPPRTPIPGKFPLNQTQLEHIGRPPARAPLPAASEAAVAPPRREAAMTAQLIAPLIPPRALPGGRALGRPGTARRLPMVAAPEVPAVPDDVLYGVGRIDESGRVADRAMTSALDWRPGDRLTLTAAAGVVIARRDPGGQVTMPAKPYIVIPAVLRRRCGLRPGDRVLLAVFLDQGTLAAYSLAVVDQALRAHAPVPGDGRQP
jgi:hypothetical protein